jgi:hypothetical protein
MKRNLIIAAVLAGAALTLPTAAPAQGGRGTSVRNDAGITLNCRIYRERRARYQTLVLRAGEQWRQEADRRQVRAIACDPPAADVRYHLRAGTAYRLVPERGSVRVVLRPI